MNRLGKIAIVPTIASGLIAAGALTGHAATLPATHVANPTHYTEAAYIRSGPATSYSAYGQAAAGDGATCYSATSGQTVSGISTWWDCTDQRTGVTGWTWGGALR